MKTVYASCLLFILMRGGHLWSQAPIQIGEIRKFQSELLQEERTFWVGLPHNYQNSAVDRYPLPVLLDGQSNFDHTWGYALLQDNKLSEAVAVFEAATQRFPFSPNAFDSLGDAFDARQEYPKALQAYQKAVDLTSVQQHPTLNYFQANRDRIQKSLAPKH